MTTRMSPRLGAACGAVFSVALFAANGNGNPGYAATVVALAALALFLPFLACLCGLLREAERENSWLATTAFAAGLVGITIKLLSAVPDVAREHTADATPLHTALEDMADSATVISLYPLALMLAAVAAIAIRTGVLPRWLGFGTAATAIALAVNGSFINAGFVPALLLFVLWTLVASVVLFRRVGGESAQVTRTRSTAPV